MKKVDVCIRYKRLKNDGGVPASSTENENTPLCMLRFPYQLKFVNSKRNVVVVARTQHLSCLRRWILAAIAGLECLNRVIEQNYCGRDS